MRRRAPSAGRNDPKPMKQPTYIPPNHKPAAQDISTALFIKRVGQRLGGNSHGKSEAIRALFTSMARPPSRHRVKWPARKSGGK